MTKQKKKNYYNQTQTWTMQIAINILLFSQQICIAET